MARLRILMAINENAPRSAKLSHTRHIQTQRTSRDSRTFPLSPSVDSTTDSATTIRKADQMRLSSGLKHSRTVHRQDQKGTQTRQEQRLGQRQNRRNRPATGATPGECLTCESQNRPHSAHRGISAPKEHDARSLHLSRGN